MEMEEQVLSKEQMKKLEELGVDTSKASMFYHRLTSSNPAKSNECYGTFLETSSTPIILVPCEIDVDTVTPMFTLQDIIDTVKGWTEYNFCVSYCCAFLFDILDSDSATPLHIEFGKTTIEAAFKLMVWCEEQRLRQIRKN